ncbi:unnamed protein product [Phaeothamnion confervicola]
MRVVCADETGLLKVAGVETGASLATAGRQARENAVGGMCFGLQGASGSPDYLKVFVSQRKGVVECWRANERKTNGINELLPSNEASLRLASSTALEGATEPLIGLAWAAGASSGASAAASLVTCGAGGSVHILRVTGSGEEGADDKVFVASSFRIRGLLSSMCTGNGGGGGSSSSAGQLAVGGRENDVKVYDLTTRQCVWRAKNLPHDSLDLAPPVWMTVVQPLASAGDGSLNRLVTCTAYGHLRIYDTRAGRRPAHSVDAAQHRITAMALSADASEAIVGDAAGELLSLDLRTLRRRRRYAGPAGSIRSISVHPTLPVFACAGLDRMLRVYDIESGVPRGQAYLKQRLTHVLVTDEGAKAAAKASRGTGSGGGEEDDSDDDLLGSGEEYAMGEEGEGSDGSAASEDAKSDTEDHGGGDDDAGDVSDGGAVVENASEDGSVAGAAVGPAATRGRRSSKASAGSSRKRGSAETPSKRRGSARGGSAGDDGGGDGSGAITLAETDAATALRKRFKSTRS